MSDLQPPAAATHFQTLGLPVRDDPCSSSATFADGGAWRVEIPSVEGPASFRAVLDAAAELDVPVHRISQGSGIMMLTDAELDEMVAIGSEHDIEVCLFVGPRAAWDIGAVAHAPAAGVVAGSVRGAEQLGYALDDVRRACDRGVRSVLVADLGLIAVIGQLREADELPGDLQVKVSVSFAVANPATARVLEDLGAGTLNLPPDLPIGAIAAIRSAVDLPLDMYVEAPDDFGGTIRLHEVPDLVRVAAPIHLKFTARNAAFAYPTGAQHEALVLALSRERVRRAALGLAILRRRWPDAPMSPRPPGAAGASAT